MLLNLPTELIVAVVVMATCGDTATGASCARVCRGLAALVTPLLYETVVLRHWRSTRAFERLLTGHTPSIPVRTIDSARGKRFPSQTSARPSRPLDHVRHLSAPFLDLASIPGRGEPILHTLAARCPNLRSLQLLQLPSSTPEVQGLVARCTALEELFVLVPYSGPVPIMRRLFFHSAAVVHESKSYLIDPVRSHIVHTNDHLLTTTLSQATRTTTKPSIPSSISRLTHVSITHGISERPGATLTSVRTLLSSTALQVLVVRLVSLPQAKGATIEEQHELEPRDTPIWHALANLHDSRIRVGIEFASSSEAAQVVAGGEPTQTQMVRMWEDHVGMSRPRQDGEDIWAFGEQVCASA